MVFLDSSVANIILPRLQESFQRDLLDLQWVVTSYGTMLSAFLLLGGALGDSFGRRRLFLIGLALFSVASAACAASQTFWSLVVARSVQGVGGALLTPESLAILNSTFPKDQRAKAVGAWSAASALTGVVGPTLGGWIAEVASWRAVFFINLPLALVSGYLAWTSIPENCSETRVVRFDFTGSLLAALGFGVFISGVTKGLVWSLAGVAILVLFCLYESRIDHPVLPLNVFRNRVFSRINLMTLFLYGALGMAFFYLPTHLIRVKHYSAAQAGMAASPVALLLALFSRSVGAYAESVGSKWFLVGGPALASLGFVALAFASPHHSYWISFFPGFLLLGAGMALTVTPLTSKALSALEDEKSGLASGINNTAARVAGVVGVALAATLITASFHARTGIADPMMPIPEGATEAFKAAVEAARWMSYRELLLASALLGVLASLAGAWTEKRH